MSQGEASESVPEAGRSESTTRVDSTLASYVPVVVQQRMFEIGGGLQEARVDTLRGALLFADISGFTALTERLAARGPAGIELLVRRLNVYFGSLIEVILDYGGDVLKFAGDALVVHFAETEDATADGSGQREALLRAGACGLAVQEAVAAERDTEEGLVLSLKVAVAMGKLACAFLGGVRGRWEMVVFGPPLLDAGEVAGRCAPGWVVMPEVACKSIADDAVAKAVGGGVMRLLQISREPAIAPSSMPKLTGAAAQAAWSFVPYAIRARLESGQGDWLAELRRITVIFVTLPGHASAVGLTQTQELMTRMQQLIYRVEGSVNKISVDDKGLSLVAVLGMPPLSHEDDPRRGLMLALDLHDLMVQLRFTSSIGVTTGRAFCGVIGSSRRREYTMIGDIVNLSARLMVASAGGVLCDQVTRDGAIEHFDFEPLPPLKLKGKSKPVAVYVPIRRSVRRIQSNSRLVGRVAECATFDAALERLTSGESATYLIEAEPGVGKTRLLAEMHSMAAKRGLHVLHGEADSIEQTAAYVAWRGLLADLLGIDQDSSGLAQAADAISKLQLHPQLLARTGLLNDILPLGLADSEATIGLEGEARAAALRTVVLDLLSDQTPLVILIDDVQWLDSASWALLISVVRGLSPLLLVCATRPFADAAQCAELRELSRRAQSQVIQLEGFDAAEVGELIRARLEVEQVSAALIQFVTERTHGNAFFVEQLLLALRESGLIEVSEKRCGVRNGVDLASELSLPDTVEGAITQRIDNLDPTEQLSLKVASVVGRAFGSSVINAIFPIEHLRGQLQPHLATLAKQGLTQMVGSEGDSSYLFRQILTQEVAYKLMLYSQRQALHLAVADWYESSFTERAPFYAMIAHHLVQAGAVQRAVHYLVLAGDQALAKFACAEAVRLYSEAVRLDQNPAQPEEIDRRAHSHRQMGHANYLLGRLETGIEELRRGLANGPAAVPRARLPKVWGVLGEFGVQVLRRRFPQRFALAAAEQRPELVEFAHAYRDLSICHYTRSEILDLLYCGLRGLNLAERLGPSAELAEALATMSVIASAAGRKQIASEYAARSDALLPKVRDISRRANMLFALGVYRSICGEWARAIETYEEVSGLAEAISNWRLLQNALFGMARSAMRCGRLRLSDQLFERLELLGRTVDHAQAAAWGLSGMLQSQSAEQRPHWESRLSALRKLLQAESAREHLSAADYALCTGGIALVLQRLGRDQEAELEAFKAGDMVLATDAVATHMLDPLGHASDVHLAEWKRSGDDQGLRARRLKQLGKVLDRFARKYPFAVPIALRIRGEFLCQLGRTAKGLAEIQTALAAALARDMLVETARCHHAMAEQHTSPTERASQRRAAVEIYKRLDMLADLDRLQYDYSQQPT